MNVYKVRYAIKPEQAAVYCALPIEEIFLEAVEDIEATQKCKKLINNSFVVDVTLI